jgi:hypothetical protein
MKKKMMKVGNKKIITFVIEEIILELNIYKIFWNFPPSVYLLLAKKKEGMIQVRNTFTLLIIPTTKLLACPINNGPIQLMLT